MEVEWWPKRAIVLFSGLQLSTQAKGCEIRPCPASKKTEGRGARLGREVHVVSKYSEIEIDEIDLLVMLQLKIHVFWRIQFARIY